jgi:hypothetical protein
LQDAWTEASQPSMADITQFLADAAAELDAVIAAHGFETPVTDAKAKAALVQANADMALLLALRATWPGGGGPAAVSDLIRDVEARVGGYQSALLAGDVPALLYLASTAGATAEGGASDFWTLDGVDYDYWVNLTAMWPRYWMTDPWGVPASQQPMFRRDERF